VPERALRRPSHGKGALALLALAVIALGGCGGDDDNGGATGNGEGGAAETATAPGAPDPRASGGPDDERLIRDAIEGVVASGDSAEACERYATEALIVAAYGDREGCEAAVTSPGGAADSVEVSEIKIFEKSATALAVPSGGPSSDERIAVVLAKEEGTWKVDALNSQVPVGP
jgi:hypothetical protein